MKRFWPLLSVTLLGFGIRSADSQKPENLPDIDVLYIERSPRYPGYRLDSWLKT